ncbi:MAG: element excision factor XisI family protein [Bacteroidota bacterium]
MDKVARHKKIAKEVLEEVAAIRTKSRFVMRTQKLYDDIHGQYMLHKYGWKRSSRIYGMIAHLEIAEDGKIWLHHDGTGLELAYVLVNKGISKKDIVLAFQPEYAREDLGFALA